MTSIIIPPRRPTGPRQPMPYRVTPFIFNIQFLNQSGFESHAFQVNATTQTVGFGSLSVSIEIKSDQSVFLIIKNKGKYGFRDGKGDDIFIKSIFIEYPNYTGQNGRFESTSVETAIEHENDTLLSELGFSIPNFWQRFPCSLEGNNVLQKVKLELLSDGNHKLPGNRALAWEWKKER